MRLDKALATHPDILSRTNAQQLIEAGLVKGAKSNLKASQKTHLHERYLITIVPKPPMNLTPTPMNLDIAYEDADLLVINKPSGLVVHPAAGHWSQTLVHGLLHHTKTLARGGDVSRPGIVHRIDKDTSGLLVVAKNDLAQNHLATQFKNKTVHRIYRAVCFGQFKTNSGTKKTYLARHPKDRKRFASLPAQNNSPRNGKLAVTHFVVEQFHPLGFSLITCRLETGRTHQIRVHLSEMGHPILGDPIYGTQTRTSRLKSRTAQEFVQMTPHLMLHAAELGFIHPRTQKELIFKTEWPVETHRALKKLQFLNTQLQNKGT